MKKFLKLFTVAIALFGVVCLASCSFDSVTSLAFNGLIKQEFELNETVDLKIKVTVDNVSKDVEIAIGANGTITKNDTGYNFVVQGFDTTTKGSKTYTVSLDGSTLSCYYVVVDNSTKDIDGDGTEISPYVIYNTTNLLAMSSKLPTGNDASTTYFKLANNLNFYGIDFTPINISEKHSVVFNGNGKTISNINYVDQFMSAAKTYTDAQQDAYDTANATGLFGMVRADLKVSNLKLDAISFEAPSNTGALIGKIVIRKDNKIVIAQGSSTVDNVSISNANLKSYKWVGGFTGNSNGNQDFTNCSISDSVILAKAKDDSATNIEDAKKVGSIIGMKQEGYVKVDNYACENVELYGSRDIGLLFGIVTGINPNEVKVSLGGNLVLSGVNKVVATVTGSSALISGHDDSVIFKASAGALIGTLHPSDSLVASDYTIGLKDYQKEIVLTSDFKILVGTQEVLFDKVNGYFAAGNSIENVLSVSSTDQLFATKYNSETFIRFIGGIRGAKDSHSVKYFVPFVK